MEDTSKKFVSVLFEVLTQKGVRNVVCSPGSRNVPLLMAAESRPRIKKFFASDERSAAFMALGMSAVKQEPVALLCTSGTALLNYSPAVAEAYYQGIPLIVISADRPIQWIDQDDSQTLRQDNALDNFVKKSFTIPADGEDNPELEWYVNRIANEAVLIACDKKPGPVHINVHISEPLGKAISKKENEPRNIISFQGDGITNKEIYRELAEHLYDKSIFLVAGFMQPDSGLQKAIAEFSKFNNVAVMAETISNLHLSSSSYSVDSTLTAFKPDFLDMMAPEVVISIGGALVSRKLKEYLRRNSDRTEHWAIGYSNTLSDPFMNLQLRVEADPVKFFRSLTAAMKKSAVESSLFKMEWELARKKAAELKDNFVKTCPWSELKAFEYIFNHIPKNHNLFLSNGTVIRYAQIITYKLPHASYCNRGVSGIDGCTSTAIGGAIAYKEPTTLITGDLSMAYDIGALAIQDIPDRFKIIVIDNRGGGIFRFIPATSDWEEKEKYLCQPPLLPLRNLAEGYGWDFFESMDEKNLHEEFHKFINNSRKSILKVTCPPEKSAEVLKNYMNKSYI